MVLSKTKLNLFLQKNITGGPHLSIKIELLITLFSMLTVLTSVLKSPATVFDVRNS